MCDRIKTARFQRPKPRAKYDRVITTCPHGAQRLYCRQRRTGDWWRWTAFFKGAFQRGRVRRWVSRWMDCVAVPEHEVPEEVMDAAYAGRAMYEDAADRKRR